jgi:hypothetical protein
MKYKTKYTKECRRNPAGGMDVCVVFYSKEKRTNQDNEENLQVRKKYKEQEKDFRKKYS